VAGWDLKGRVALVTGASSGIGRGLALALAERGMHVALAARGEEELAAAAAECRAFGVRALPVVTDVAEPEQCKRLVERAAAELGGLDLLVNNAGVGMWARFQDVTDLSIYERLMRVNYLGAVHVTHAALPHLIARKGLVVAVSSLTGKTGVPMRSGYGAAKHALQGFCDAIRIELAPTGVEVLVVSPGFVATDVRTRGFGADGKPVGESPRDEEHGNMPVERCVAIMLKAIARREREVVMTAKAKVGLWLKLIAPGVVDKMAARAVLGKGSD
jgi:NAD(P)-dependent dehydrogenase (short-subunit alcohol dehydrogenase family)